MDLKEEIVACSGEASTEELLASMQLLVSPFSQLPQQQSGSNYGEDVREILPLNQLRCTPDYEVPFEVHSIKIRTDVFPGASNAEREVLLQVSVGSVDAHLVSEGVSTVDALDKVFRKGLLPHYPNIEEMEISAVQVFVFDAEGSASASTQVFIEASNGSRSWRTVGVSEDVFEASALAVSDSYEYYISSERQQKHKLL